MLLMATFTVNMSRILPNGIDWLLETIVAFICLIILLIIALITKEPQHESCPRNSIPCVPLLPICAIWMDIYLIVCLPSSSWLAFIIWMLIGQYSAVLVLNKEKHCLHHVSSCNLMKKWNAHAATRIPSALSTFSSFLR